MNCIALAVSKPFYFKTDIEMTLKYATFPDIILNVAYLGFHVTGT